MYTWANSISKGVSRERGGGFTVTEMTLEFRTVVFLVGAQRQQSQGLVCGLASPGTGPPPLLQASIPGPSRPAHPARLLSPAQGSLTPPVVGSVHPTCPPLQGQEAAQVPVKHSAHHEHGGVVSLWKGAHGHPPTLPAGLGPLPCPSAGPAEGGPSHPHQHCGWDPRSPVGGEELCPSQVTPEGCWAGRTRFSPRRGVLAPQVQPAPCPLQ